MKGGEILSGISVASNVKFLTSVASDTNIASSSNSSVSGSDNSTNFKNILQTKTENSGSPANTNKSTESSTAASEGTSDKQPVVIKQQATTSINDVSDKTDEEKLQDIEKEVDDIQNGTKIPNNDDVASMIASLQQMLTSLLNNNSATQSTLGTQSTSGTLDANLTSKLTDLKNDLTNYVSLLSTDENGNDTQALSESISKLGLGKTDSTNDISSTQTASIQIPSTQASNVQIPSTQTASVQIPNTQASNVQIPNIQTSSTQAAQIIQTSTPISTDANKLLSDIKNELTDLMKDAKSSESSSNLTVVSSKLNYVQDLLKVTSKALNTASSLGTGSLTDTNKLNNVTQVDFNTPDSSSLSSDSSGSSSYSSNYSSNDTSSGSGNTFSNNSSKDTDFLNTLIDNKGSSSDKYSKVTSIMNQLLNTNNVSSTSEIKSETPVVRSSNFSEDLITSLKYMDSNNIKDMTVTIAPKELGTVMINITSENGVMKASITATNKEAYNLLNANADQINSSLNSQEIKVSNVNINIYNGDTTYFKDSSNSQNSTQQDQKRAKPQIL